MVTNKGGLVPCMLSFRYQDESTQATFVVFASSRWLGLRLDMISSLMVIIVAAGAVLTSQNPGK